jgi:hypothetical protein
MTAITSPETGYPTLSVLEDAPSSVTEREKRIQEALGTVISLTQMVNEGELPIRFVDSSDEISASPGIYWLDRNTDTEAIEDVNFTFMPENLSGAADSAHAIVPGKLTTKKNDSTVSDMMVVCKCYSKREFPDRLARALQEVHVMQRLSTSGILTIEPIAVAIAPWVGTKGEVVLITRQNLRLITLDNLPWAQKLMPQNIANAKDGARAVSEFNKLGFIHYDAKVKNVAQDEEGHMAMIDFETAREIDLTAPQEVALATYTDFSKYLDSLWKKGFFGTSKRHTNASLLREVVGEIQAAYLDVWAQDDDKIAEQVLMAVENATELNFPGLDNSNGFYNRI